MPSSSSSAKRGAPSEVVAPPLKSKQRDTHNQYQMLDTMNINSSNRNKLSSNQNYANYQKQQQQQALSTAAMMTNYHEQQQQQQQRHHNYALGSQTISRSNNVHKQFYANARAGSAYAQQQQAAAVAAASGYYFYDQPHYQAQLYAPSPQQQHQQQQYYHQMVPYAPMSLAVRSPKQRAAIPLGPLMAGYGLPGGHLTRTLGRPSSCHVKEPHQPQPQQVGVKDAAQALPSAARLIYQEPTVNLLGSHLSQQARLNKPLCRCRVMYLGSSVPHITKNGLHGIQEPLRHLYPEEQFNASNLRTSSSSSSRHESFDLGGSTASPAHGQVTKISNTIDISHLSSSLGIDSWLSVWSNGLLLENVDEFGREMRRFYSIESLHYCAAVRFFDTTTLARQSSSGQQTATQAQQQQQNGSNEPVRDDNNNSSEISNNNNNSSGSLNNNKHEASSITAIKSGANGTSNGQASANYTLADNGSGSKRGVVRFLPLDAPIFQYPGMLDANHPPVFAAIMRRTSGIKVLECHAFICRRDAAANALVRCCTHAYSDFLSAKRLSADFGLLQQQQLSAYIGNSGTNAFVPTANNPAHLEQHRTQTMPSVGRHFRSTSAGRHLARHQQRTSAGGLLDNGQYQVIDAEVVHHQPNGATSKSRKSKAAVSKILAERRHHHHGANNSTGTNSNELTHSDDNDLNSRDNSDDEPDEDEDNYAIITKHKHQQQRPVEPTSNQERTASAKSSRLAAAEIGSARPVQAGQDRSRTGARRRSRKAKGSSKSLFSDFMPQPAELSPVGGAEHAAAVDRLSHSLDYLQMIANQGGKRQTAGSNKAHARAHYHSGPETDGPLGLDEAGATYSTVTGDKCNKRHSKSMQDLQLIGPEAGGPLHEPVGAQYQLVDGAGAIRCEPDGGSEISKQRKAASYQDILRPAPPPPPPCESPPASFGSLARRHSSRNSSARTSLASASTATRSRRTSRQRRSGPKGGVESVSGGLDAGRSQRHEHSRRHGSRERSMISLSDANTRIYANCAEDAHGNSKSDPNVDVNGNEAQSSDLRVLRPEYCATARGGVITSEPVSERASGQKSRSRRKSQPIDDGPLIDAYYPHPMAGPDLQLYPGSLCSPRPAHSAPIYMPAYFMQPDHQHQPLPAPVQTLQQGPIYGPGSLYDAITPPPGGPYVSVPYNSAHYHPAQVPLFSAMALHQQHQQVPSGYAMMPPAGELGSEPGCAVKKGAGGSKSKASKTAASRLATKFRCLSPPLNFFGSPAASGADLQAAPEGESRCPLAEQEKLAPGQGRPSGSSSRSQVASVPEGDATCRQDGALRRQQKRQSGASSSGEGHGSSSSSSGLVSPAEIVSARPGFVSQQLGSGDAPKSSAKRDKAPRMSWIKRLSMSLSSGAASGPAEPAVEPSGPDGTHCSLPSPPLSDVGERDETNRKGPADTTTTSAEAEHANGSAPSGATSDLNNSEPASGGGPIIEAPLVSSSCVETSAPNGLDQQKPKRKRGGLFSGVLTLGRSSGAKQARDKKLTEAASSGAT